MTNVQQYFDENYATVGDVLKEMHALLDDMEVIPGHLSDRIKQLKVERDAYQSALTVDAVDAVKTDGKFLDAQDTIKQLRAALEAAQNTIRDLEQRIQFWSAGREVKDTFLAQNPEETR